MRGVGDGQEELNGRQFEAELSSGVRLMRGCWWEVVGSYREGVGM